MYWFDSQTYNCSNGQRYLFSIGMNKQSCNLITKNFFKANNKNNKNSLKYKFLELM